MRVALVVALQKSATPEHEIAVRIGIGVLTGKDVVPLTEVNICLGCLCEFAANAGDTLKDKPAIIEVRRMDIHEIAGEVTSKIVEPSAN